MFQLLISPAGRYHEVVLKELGVETDAKVIEASNGWSYYLVTFKTQEDLNLVKLSGKLKATGYELDGFTMYIVI